MRKKTNTINLKYLWIILVIIIGIFLIFSQIIRVTLAALNSQDDVELQKSDVVYLEWFPDIDENDAFGQSVKAFELGLSQKEAQNTNHVARAFLENLMSPVKGVSAELDWVEMKEETDKLGITHSRFQQIYNDLDVFGGEVIVHTDESEAIAANGIFLSSVNISTRPKLSAQSAFEAATQKLELYKYQIDESRLKIFNPEILHLGSSTNYLVYELIVSSEEPPDAQTIIVDANTGKVLLNYTNIQTGRNRQIYDLHGSTSLPGTQCFNESGSVGGTPSSDCTSAYSFTGDTYDYFSSSFGRDSFDNNGAVMRTSVRYGNQANAFWNGSQTVFGPGFATKDVVSHEWAHGVTQHSANLVYSYQSGALNESMSDIFGAMVDRDDWSMGEDTPIGAIRSLQDPTLYGDPGKVSDSQFYCGHNDNGGVHINSGVPNHAAYLMSDGGSYNGRTISGIGRNRTEQIFYRALTVYFSSTTGFNQAYTTLRSACADLYGSSSTYCTNTTNALQAVEMFSTSICSSGPPPDTYEPDDSPSQANTITVNGSAQTHNFYVAGDNDWVKFWATNGRSYVIETFNLGGFCDTLLFLYDNNGTTLIAYNDDYGGGLGSRISWTAPADGYYYIRVRHYSSSAYGLVTNYDLKVNGTLPPDTMMFFPIIMR
ncbi:M4 family metallopeptidase [Chloroflexota bacterium]